MTAASKTIAPAFHPVSAPDYLPPAQLRELQLMRLRNIVARAWDRVPLQKARMTERGLTPSSIESLADIGKLPFTTKADLRDTYPFGLFASPMEEVVRLHASSGTTGKPIVVAYTQQDVDVWTSVMVRSFAICGLHHGDVIQNAYGYGLFTGGLGAHYGAEGLGATVIPISGGNTDRQIMVMKDFGVTAICCTPSYFLHLIERAAELGVDMRELPLRAGVFGAEPWTDAMRKQHRSVDRHPAPSTSTASRKSSARASRSSANARTACTSSRTTSIPRSSIPKPAAVLPDGAEGELVLTTLSKQAMPMIRYRTRDITALIPEPCPCGRTLRRMRRIGRRSDDMLIIRGVNVFPSQMEAALLAVEGTLPHYQIVLTRMQGLDQMEVQVEVTAESFSDKIGALEELNDRIADALEHVLGMRVHVTLVEPHTIQRSEGKAKRVIDRRLAS